MKLPAWKRAPSQGFLFDEPLRGQGHIRTLVGDFFEGLSERLLGAKRFRTDGTVEYCPDLGSPTGFFECKAAGLSHQTFIYSGRLIKDREFSLTNRLCYIIWNHSVATKNHSTVSSLREALGASVRGVYLVPFPAIDAICQGLKEEPLNSAYGPKHTRPASTAAKTYGSGYRLSLGRLSQWRISYDGTFRTTLGNHLSA